MTLSSKWKLMSYVALHPWLNLLKDLIAKSLFAVTSLPYLLKQRTLLNRSRPLTQAYIFGSMIEIRISKNDRETTFKVCKPCTVDSNQDGAEASNQIPTICNHKNTDKWGRFQLVRVRWGQSSLPGKYEVFQWISTWRALLSGKNQWEIFLWK